MKKETKSNKKIALIYFFASLCFYVGAIMNFINGDNKNIAVIFFCLGSSNLCLGSVFLNKDKENNNDKK